MKFKSLPNIFAIVSIVAFLVLKLSSASIHFGDGNVYTYASGLIIRGYLPYRDFFLVVPPFLLYFLSACRLIIGNFYLGYQFIPIILEALSAFFIFLTLKKINLKLAFLSPLLYLSTFTIISTSDYLTGVQLVNFLTSLSLYLLSLKKFALSGVVLTLGFMTKFYVLPIIAGASLSLIPKPKKLASLIIAFTTASILIALPFLLLAPSQTFHDLISHQLGRGEAISKIEIFSVFLSKEWPLLVLSIIAGFVARRKVFIFLAPGAALLVFFLIFKDLYYLYLASLLPFLVILSTYGLEYIYSSAANLRWIFYSCLLFIFFFQALQIYDYTQTVGKLGRFENYQEVASYISSLPPDFPLYGNHDITPLIALITGKPMFENIIDTNPRVFDSKALNVQQVSTRAAERGIYFIARTIYRPELKIENVGFEGYFDRAVFDKHCKLLKTFPGPELEQYNQISIYRCEVNKEKN